MTAATDERVQAVRAFNRFITASVGALDEGLLGSAFSLTEGRVLFELSRRETHGVGDVRDALGLDSGYLSRILTRLERAELITRARATGDGRRQTVALTDAGRVEVTELDRRSSDANAAVLERLSDADQRLLLTAMGRVRRLLGDATVPRDVIVLRLFEPGDYGWVVSRHGALYASEYGWDERMEALVARIVADFIEDREPGRDNAWIAEVDGEPAGCVFCMRGDSADTARLRLLLVEPGARGLGIGSRLVEQCLRFGRRAGYRRMTLWTQSVLESAHRIYAAAGFELVDSELHHSFGVDLVGQTWELDL